MAIAYSFSKRLKLIAAALFSLMLNLMLSGCAVPDAPRYSDDLLHPATQASEVSLRHDQNVGVIFSENTLTNLTYLKRYHAMAEHGPQSRVLDAQIRQAYVDSSEPEMAIDWLNASLSRQFKSVTYYTSIDALLDAEPDVIVVLDTQSQLVTERSSDVKARVTAQFFDGDLNYIGQADGQASKDMPPMWTHTKRAAEIASDITEQRTVQVQALQRFDTSLDELMGPRA